MLETIWPGMPVIDVADRPVGWVRLVEPGAVTNDGASSLDDDLEATCGRAWTEPGVSLEIAEDLIRHGFVRIHGPEPYRDRYVPAQQINLGGLLH